MDTIDNSNSRQSALVAHQQRLYQCSHCPNMIGPVITGEPVLSPVLLIGQAPGIKEGDLGRSFAWTAGKTLFKWFDSVGLDEARFRKTVYMAAVCRCFPGKNPKGGDRVPSRDEIAQCSDWLQQEIQLLQPRLVLPVGKLAIQQLMPVDKLKDVIGQQHRIRLYQQTFDVIPLPHPSGASTWHRMEPGKSLLVDALQRVRAHPAWQSLCGPDQE